MLSLQSRTAAGRACCPGRRCVTARAVVADGSVATRPLQLHAGETTIALPFTTEKARELQGEFQKLFQAFGEKQKSTRPKRFDMMEWVHADDKVSLEVFCNPNAHSTAFDAKLLITLVSAGGLRVTTEARLSGVTSDIDNWLQGL
ncbi:hypothetical protein HYH03_010866 [Edaphochlamys debaryana]|uniref:Uncharacterized protein n=1 Tax=Edaphochlamys debaryana TaxID=47281 RepID=A0A836BVR1_9CHLO|nr:hypothetical protein HYH03_010866 [Edaphochlamys debaryana]|eukprot:KAG2490705.1 hypothetical protein HYH03_010866 [Edaphochlamys debaryana]